MFQCVKRIWLRSFFQPAHPPNLESGLVRLRPLLILEIITTLYIIIVHNRATFVEWTRRCVCLHRVLVCSGRAYAQAHVCERWTYVCVRTHGHTYVLYTIHIHTHFVPDISHLVFKLEGPERVTNAPVCLSSRRAKVSWAYYYVLWEMLLEFDFVYLLFTCTDENSGFVHK